MRKIVSTSKAPAAIGPYSQANIVGDLVFTSGQIPICPETGKLVDGGIEAQTKQVFQNIKAILEEAGSGLDKVIKTTCFLADMDDFATMNQIYGSYFAEGAYPSRSAFQVAKLPMGALIEIEVIAEK
ncbi:MAG: RidA family protein [Bacillota bacterium]|nr:RidA family protein [Bacillota bacterium]